MTPSQKPQDGGAIAGLTIAMVTSSLEDDEDLPDGPCVVLRDSVDAVRSAAKLLGQQVSLIAQEGQFDD